MLKCDLHGPWSPEMAALIVAGRVKPKTIGYLCDDCQRLVSAMATSLAISIDSEIENALFSKEG